MVRRRRRAAAGLVAALVLAGCGADGGGSARVEVVAAFYPLAEVARQVGAELVDVTDLTPAGAEPHDREARPSTVEAIDGADVVVVLGDGFQPAFEELADRRDGPTVVVLDAVPAGDGDLAGDPHVWLDPTLMARIVSDVEAALAEADPDHAAEYAANAQRYRDELAALDAEFESGLAHCERDQLVTAHTAFGWLARRYGLEQHAIAGVSPDQEPSAARLAELSDLVEAEGVTTIFTESLVSPDIARTLAREAGVSTATLNPLEGLTGDEGDAGADYLSVMRDNLAALRPALGCDP